MIGLFQEITKVALAMKLAPVKFDGPGKKLEGMNEDKTVLCSSTIKNVSAEVSGVFGLDRLDTLDKILKLPYSHIEFQNDQLLLFDGPDQNTQFKILDINLVPTMGKYTGKPDQNFPITSEFVQRFSSNHKAMSKIVTYFHLDVVGDQLNFVFGEGNRNCMTMHVGETSLKLEERLHFNSDHIYRAFKLSPGTGEISIDSDGALLINFETDRLKWCFIFPARMR